MEMLVEVVVVFDPLSNLELVFEIRRLKLEVQGKPEHKEGERVTR